MKALLIRSQSFPGHPQSISFAINRTWPWSQTGRVSIFGDGSKGIFAGLLSVIVGAFIVATGLFVSVNVFHSRVGGRIQPRVPQPQPGMPLLTELGDTI